MPVVGIVCRRWATLLANTQAEHVLHLGRRRAETGPWQVPQTAGTFSYNDLDDLFELRQQQSELRDQKVLAARNACELLAQESSRPH